MDELINYDHVTIEGDRMERGLSIGKFSRFLTQMVGSG